jgi:hypothetical protein
MTLRKKILIFQWFDCKNDDRKKELEECALHNISMGFDEVIIYNDSVEPIFFGEQIKNIATNRRITYRDYIDFLNLQENYGSFVVLTNTDIKIDKELLGLSALMQPIDFISLSRYEINGELASSPAFTQDTWAMLSQPIHQSIIHQSSIPLGMPGCENRFSEIIFNVGYRVFNPCLDIKNQHIQKIPSVHKLENKIYGAILTIPPCLTQQIISGVVDEYPRPYYLPSFHQGMINIGSY